MSNKKNKILVVERVVDAPISTVWNAWTDGDMVAQWWATKTLKRTIVTEYDFVPGGTWQQHGIDIYGDTVGEHNAGAVFTEIVPYERIVTTPKPTDDEVVEIVPDIQRTIIEFDSLSDTSTRIAMYLERSRHDEWQPNELLISVYNEIFDGMVQWVVERNTA